MKLIATDVDGTLIHTDHTLTRRTRDAFRAARAAGFRVVAISGRQPYSIGAIVQGTALMGPCVGSNGAVVTDLETRQVLWQATLDVDVQRRLVDEMTKRFPHLKVVSVRHGGDLYFAEDGYQGLADPGELETLWPVEQRIGARDEVLAEPSGKLVLRDDRHDPSELLAAARGLGIDGFHATTSGAPFLEVGPVGITKAATLGWLCDRWGIAPADVVAFGDNLNDVEMLRFAGRGVAMGNALPETKQAADEVTLTNDEDGVAAVIESLL